MIVQLYPADTSDFLKRKKDRFDNPVGYAINCETEDIFNILLAESTPDQFSSIAEGIVKIRAVQDFSASQAVSFIFLLKKAIREKLETEIRQNVVSEQLLVFESRIDELALSVFDIYMQCREKVHEIRLNEVKNGMFKLRERKNSFVEDGLWKPLDLTDDRGSLKKHRKR